MLVLQLWYKCERFNLCCRPFWIELKIHNESFLVVGFVNVFSLGSYDLKNVITVELSEDNKNNYILIKRIKVC